MTTDTVLADRARKWGKLKGVEVVPQCWSHGQNAPCPADNNDCRIDWGELKTDDRWPHRVPDPATPEGMVAWQSLLWEKGYRIAIESIEQGVAISPEPHLWYFGEDAPTLLAAFANAVDKLEVGT